MAEFRLTNFRPDHAGIRAIFTGAGMQAAVAEAAEALAAQANSIAAGHHVDHEPVEGEPYRASTYVGRGTAMGFVGPRGRVGHLDQAIYHTLDSVNH